MRDMQLALGLYPVSLATGYSDIPSAVIRSLPVFSNVRSCLTSINRKCHQQDLSNPDL